MMCRFPLSTLVSTRDLGGTASPSGRYGVRSRSRPSDQALRVLAASGGEDFDLSVLYLARNCAMILLACCLHAGAHT